MSLDSYLAPRLFRSPYLGRTERISGAAILGAALSGPFYYWKKKAPVEALIIGTAELVLFVTPSQFWGTTYLGMTTPGFMLWLGAALLAPVLLPIAYRRKGWVEVT